LFDDSGQLLLHIYSIPLPQRGAFSLSIRLMKSSKKALAIIIFKISVFLGFYQFTAIAAFTNPKIAQL